MGSSRNFVFFLHAPRRRKGKKAKNDLLLPRFPVSSRAPSAVNEHGATANKALSFQACREKMDCIGKRKEATRRLIRLIEFRRKGSDCARVLLAPSCVNKVPIVDGSISGLV